MEVSDTVTSPVTPQGFLSEVFGGQLSSRVACGSCDYTSVTLESFMDLSLPIPSASLAKLHTSEPDRCTPHVLDWRLKFYIVGSGWQTGLCCTCASGISLL